MNNGPEFFQTRMGRVFYENHIPKIAKSLESIAKSLNEKDLGKEEDESKKIDIELSSRIKLKVYQAKTDFKGLCIDIVNDGEELPLLLIEDKDGKLSVYLWEDQENEDFTYKAEMREI